MSKGPIPNAADAVAKSDSVGTAVDFQSIAVEIEELSAIAQEVLRRA